MNASDMILQMCVYEKVSVAELAMRIGQTRQNLFKKLKDGTRIENGNTARNY